jgi:hypothetical protein
VFIFYGKYYRHGKVCGLKFLIFCYQPRYYYHRLLRRSVYLSVLYSAIASQFTQSEAKGRTLHRSVRLSSGLILLSFSFREGRCCNAKPNIISTTSTLYLYSTFSKTPIDCGVFEKRGLCAVPLLWRG